MTVDNNGFPIGFGYDALNRRTRIYIGDQSDGYGVQKYGGSMYGGSNVASTQYFEYDPVGNMTRMIDGWGASNFAYDVLNRISRRSTPKCDSVYYTYDAVSNLSKLQCPRGTNACYYVYDADNRMLKCITLYAGRCLSYSFNAR